MTECNVHSLYNVKWLRNESGADSLSGLSFLPHLCIIVKCRGLLLYLNTLKTHANTHTVGRTPLDEESAHRRYLYLIIHDAYKRQTSMPRWIPTRYFIKRAAAALGIGRWKASIAIRGWRYEQSSTNSA